MKSTEASTTRVLSAAITKLLRPLVRLLLRYGIPFGAFSDLAKRAYVDTAHEHFQIPGRKPTISRVSIITGLSRKEISRVLDDELADDSEQISEYNRAARVISGWVRDEVFTTRAGSPRALPFEGKGASFSALVRRYSGDVPPRAILDELLRVGSVTVDAKHRVSLKTRAYVPAEAESGKLAILGADVADLISTIDHNLQASAGEAFFQRKVAYDNLPIEGTENLRDIAADKSQDLLEELDRWMAARDRDSAANVKGQGTKRAMLGIYYYEEPVLNDDASTDNDTDTEDR